MRFAALLSGSQFSGIYSLISPSRSRPAPAPAPAPCGRKPRWQLGAFSLSQHRTQPGWTLTHTHTPGTHNAQRHRASGPAGTSQMITHTHTCSMKCTRRGTKTEVVRGQREQQRTHNRNTKRQHTKRPSSGCEQNPGSEIPT